MDMRRLMTIKAVEEQAIRTWNIGNRGHASALYYYKKMHDVSHSISDLCPETTPELGSALFGYSSSDLAVAVGMPVTRHPPHRSRRAALPHRAPASGRDAQALRGIRMKDMGFGQPVLGEGIHARPCHPVALTASAQRLTAITHDGVAGFYEQAPIARHGIVAIVPQQHAFQPGPLLRDAPVHAPPQRLFHGLQFLA